MLEKNEKICVKTGEIHMEINSYPELFMTVLIPVLPSAVLILNDQ